MGYINKHMQKNSSEIPSKLKKRLYPVVLEFFSRNDFHQVNIRKISAAASVSTGTIYKYFPSKEALILRILEEKIEELKNRMERHFQGIESTREKFRKAFWVLMDAYDDLPGLAVTFFITVPTRTWMQRGTFMRYDIHNAFVRVIKEGRSRGEIDPLLSDSRITSLFFMHCYREIQVWYFHGMEWKLVDTIDKFFPVFWKTVSLS